MDTRISREEVAGFSPERLYPALIQPVWDDISRATAGQAVVASTTHFIREVDNGGLDQAFHNLTLEEIQFALDSFDRLGAGQHAAIVRLALARLVEGEWPRSDEELKTRLDEITREWIDENFDELDEQLYDERQLYPYFERFVAEYPDEFFRPA